MAKSCECFGEIESAICKQTEDPAAELDAAFTMSGEAFPRISYTYRKKKRNGDFQTKKTEGAIMPRYCPFCGKKYSRE